MHILDWMADAIQNPAKRPGVALVIKGKQGVEGGDGKRLQPLVWPLHH